jgi:hypothetical protein
VVSTAVALEPAGGLADADGAALALCGVALLRTAVLEAAPVLDERCSSDRHWRRVGARSRAAAKVASARQCHDWAIFRVPL